MRIKANESWSTIRAFGIPLTATCAVLAALTISPPALAQNQEQNQDQNQQQPAQAAEAPQDQQQQAKAQPPQPQQQSSQLAAARRQRMILIAIDTDGDGIVDFNQYISPDTLRQILGTDENAQSAAQPASIAPSASGVGVQAMPIVVMPQSVACVCPCCAAMQSASPAMAPAMQSIQAMSPIERVQLREAMAQRIASQQSQQIQVQGEILNMRAINLAGENNPHLFCKIQEQDGRVIPTDLGPWQALRDVNLNAGDQVLVIGTLGTINGRPVLLAQEIQYQNSGAQGGAGAANQPQQLQGRVLSTRTAQFRGLPSRHFLATVELIDGGIQVVDLGPQGEVQSLQIRPGDNVQVSGRAGSINGQPIFVADEVTTRNGNIQIDRSQEIPG